jgi:hypothetical protein
MEGTMPVERCHICWATEGACRSLHAAIYAAPSVLDRPMSLAGIKALHFRNETKVPGGVNFSRSCSVAGRDGSPRRPPTQATDMGR